MSNAPAAAPAPAKPVAAAATKPAAPAGVKAEEGFLNPFAIDITAGRPETLKTNATISDKRLQPRTDLDTGSSVDEGRAAIMAEALEGGAKLPPVKVIRVKDMPGAKKDEVRDVLFDGHHTHRAKVIAKQDTIEALVWDGTWAQALSAAAMHANREHEKNGKPLSSRDKVHAVKLLAAAYTGSELPKKDWPSNRQAAEMVGCSRQLVNDMDPFCRGKGNVREEKNLLKAADRAVAKVKTPAHYQIVTKDAGSPKVVAEYDAESAEDAMARHKGASPTADLSKVVARLDKAAAPGSVKSPGFDWTGVDANLGYLIRGLDAMGDLYDLKKSPEYTAAFNGLDTFAKAFRDWRKKLSGKKPEASTGQPAAAATAPK